MALFNMIDETNSNNIKVEEFTKGIQLFESSKFEAAEAIFQSLDDKTSKYLKNVAHAYKYYTFSDSWSGEIKIDKDGNLIELENGLVNDQKIDALSNEQGKKLLDELLVSEDVHEILKLISKHKTEKMNTVLKNY
jgi:hypothetical protein